MRLFDFARTKHLMAIPVTGRANPWFLVLQLCFSAIFFSVSPNVSAGNNNTLPDPILNCANPSDAVINEVYDQGGDSFVEIKLTGDEVNVADWLLCDGNEQCYPLNGDWLVNDPTNDEILAPGTYPTSTYLSIDIGSNAFSGNDREFVLFNSVAKTDVIDYFIAVKNNDSALCSQSVFGKTWQVPDSCGSCLVAQANNHKDYSRMPDGVGNWKNEDSESTRGENNQGDIEPLALDHFLLAYPNIGSTCDALPVMITARDQENNTIADYIGQVVLTVSSSHGNWSLDPAFNSSGGLSPNPDNDDNGLVSYQFKAGDNGVAYLLLKNTHADSGLTITVTDKGVDPDVSNTGPIVNFSDNVFVITDADPQIINDVKVKNIVVAGRDHEYHVALRSKNPDDPGDGCAITTNYKNAAQNLSAWLVRDGDDPAGLAPQIQGVALPVVIPDGPTATEVQLNFISTDDEFATFLLKTSDVGKYRIYLQDNSGDYIAGNIDGSSMVQTVRPFGLAFSNIKGNEPDNKVNPKGDETSAANKGFVAAGEKFELTLGAYRYQSADDSDSDRLPDDGSNITDNGVTEAFNAPTTVSVDADTYTPAGVKGDLTGETGIATGAVNYTDGKVTLTKVTYSEVGSINLTASVSNYLGSGIIVSGNSEKIGRFYPDHFELVTLPGEVSVTNTCVAGGFSYMGQDNIEIKYTLKAMNALAQPTVNYDDNTLGYTDAASIVYHAKNNNSGPELNSADRLSVPDAPKWVKGQYIVNTDTDKASFEKLTTIEGPYHNLQLGITIGSELDGRNFTNYTAGDIEAIGDPLDMRFGRAILKNAFGPEYADLAMPIELQYYNGSRFVINTTDSCSIPTVATLPTPLPLPTSVAEVTVTATGLGSVLLTAPNLSAVGEISVTLEVENWLKFDWDADATSLDQNPSAVATFGRYRGNDRVIYWREVK